MKIQCKASLNQFHFAKSLRNIAVVAVSLATIAIQSGVQAHALPAVATDVSVSGPSDGPITLVTVALLDANGTPYSIIPCFQQEGGVYDLTGAYIGTIDAATGLIYDTDGHLVASLVNPSL